MDLEAIGIAVVCFLATQLYNALCIASFETVIVSTSFRLAAALGISCIGGTERRSSCGRLTRLVLACVCGLSGLATLTYTPPVSGPGTSPLSFLPRKLNLRPSCLA